MTRFFATSPRHRRQRHRAPLLGVALATVLFASACTGPIAELEVGMNTRSVELLLGERIKAVAEAPVPPALPGGFADLLDRSSSSARRDVPFSYEDEASVTACPEAPPDASLLNQVSPSATLPPAPAKYEYRTTGEVAAGDRVTSLPPTTTREVANPRKESTGSFLFDVITTVEEQKTTATFRIVPEWFPEKPPDAVLPPEDAPGTRSQPGLYLVRVDSGPDSIFRLPDPGIKFVTFPVEPGATFSTAGTDGMTTMSFTSTVSSTRPRIDACGALIDAYQVDLEGTITSTTDQGTIASDFTSTYGVATQFGALIVWEKTTVTSEDVTRTIEATIKQIPADPQEPGGQ